jgi:hypothetical protein
VFRYLPIEIPSVGDFEATCQLRCVQAPRQFQQSERVAAALRDDLGTDGGIYRAVQVV